MPQWDIWHILPQLELNLLAYSLLFNKVVCLDPRIAQCFELGAARPTGRATLAVPPDGGVARGIEIVHTVENTEANVPAPLIGRGLARGSAQQRREIH